jgi:FAD/FMN-containing dehydrogenase
VARGLGRSYGDASLCTNLTLDTWSLVRLRSFYPQTGTLECEAGLSMQELLSSLVPRGWFPRSLRAHSLPPSAA